MKYMIFSIVSFLIKILFLYQLKSMFFFQNLMPSKQNTNENKTKKILPTISSRLASSIDSIELISFHFMSLCFNSVARAQSRIRRSSNSASVNWSSTTRKRLKTAAKTDPRTTRQSTASAHSLLTNRKLVSNALDFTCQQCSLSFAHPFACLLFTVRMNDLRPQETTLSTGTCTDLRSSTLPQRERKKSRVP